jgi:Fe-S-cluster-containing hydrogenase component 2
MKNNKLEEKVIMNNELEDISGGERRYRRAYVDTNLCDRAARHRDGLKCSGAKGDYECIYKGCPQNAIMTSLSDGYVVIAAPCIGCRACIDWCGLGAIKF